MNKKRKDDEARKALKSLKKRQQGKGDDSIIQEEDFDLDIVIDMGDLYDADDMSVEDSSREDSDEIEEESADESVEQSDSEREGEKSDDTADGKKHSAKSNGVIKKEKSQLLCFTLIVDGS